MGILMVGSSKRVKSVVDDLTFNLHHVLLTLMGVLAPVRPLRYFQKPGSVKGPQKIMKF